MKSWQNQLLLEKQTLQTLFVSGYLLSTAKVFNVTPIDGAKFNKMFTNKCTTAQIKVKERLIKKSVGQSSGKVGHFCFQ